MALTLTDAQLTAIANAIYILKTPAPAVLPKPANSTGASSLAARLDPIKAKPEFKDLSIGVVDFTAGVATPKIWLHNEDKPWRLGSAGKIAVLLAAAQLRDDVRAIKALPGIPVTTAAEFDELFALKALWDKSADTKIRALASAATAPRISTMFDLAAARPDYLGATTPLDKTHLATIHLGWAAAKTFTMWERLWLTGSRSDNVAASSCVSEIGVAYMKAVQRAYGLFSPPDGMHMLLAQGYGAARETAAVNTTPTSPKYRKLRNLEQNFTVSDVFIEPGKDPHESGQPASVAALTAYLIALMQNKFGSGADACDMIRTHLADEGLLTTTSLIFEGVQSVPATVTKAHTKLGILGTLRCEFAYIEAGGRKYGVLAQGILPRGSMSEIARGRQLGKDIHLALTAP